MTLHVRRGTKLGVGESRAAVIGLGMAAWVIGLGVMAFTSAEKPRAVEAAPPHP